MNLMESSILDQDEWWQHTWHMQVGWEEVFPVRDKWVTRKSLHYEWKLEQQLEAATNTS